VLYHPHEYSPVVVATDRRLAGRKRSTQFLFIYFFLDVMPCVTTALNERTQKMRNSTVNIFIKEKIYYKNFFRWGGTAQSH